MSLASSPVRARALITGASSGIGAVFAERLARDGFDLVLVARRRQRLEDLAQRLTDECDVDAEVIDADLTDVSDLDALEAQVAEDGTLTLLINNAGFGGYNPFVSLVPDVIDDLIDIHIRTVTRLTRAALPGMVDRGAGAVINIASMLAFSGTLPPNPLPHRAVYAGAKAYLLTFTQALAGELTGTGVRVQVCMPGIVDTEFHTIQGIDPSKIASKLQPQDIVTASLAGLAKGEVVCIPGLADAALFDALGEAQRTVMRAGALQSAGLAERYRQVG